jgi:molecular chaperone DnaK (HSP70)
MADIGIDLGTTNSVLAHLRGGPEVINIKGRPLLPSAVAYDDGEFLVGSAAKNLAASMDDVIVSPKRYMGTDKTYQIAGRKYTPVDFSAMILKEIKKHAEEFLGEPVTSAIITIPAHFNQQQVEDTRKAAEQAGLKVGRLLPEPVAASATYGGSGEETILVFDLGGGTLDCTVVDTFDNKILGLSGDNWLGGDDFDNRIVDRMCRELKESQGIDVSGNPKARQALKAKAELAKINLSEANSTQVEFMGKLDGKLSQVDFRLKRSEYNEMIKDLVDKALEKADEAVERAEMSRKDIDVILLVGGSTLTPYVQERLEQHFGKPCSKQADPMLAVGLGAAKCTRDLGLGAGEHRVLLRSRAEVWSKPSYTIKGRTTANSRIEITGGAAPIDLTADANGQFSADVKLTPNAVNDVTVKATTPAGEAAKAVQRIRHDAGAEADVEPDERGMLDPPLPRNILVGVKGDFVAAIVRAGVSLPASGEVDQFWVEANPAPFILQIPIYEGHMPEHEIPYGPFNTHMGMLQGPCPPTAQQTQIVIAFEVDESRNISVRYWFKHDPSVSGSVTVNGAALDREKIHLIERAETTVNTAGDRIRPDEKARINRKRQALIDLSEQFGAQQSDATRQQIIQTGNELRSDLQAIERKLNL